MSNGDEHEQRASIPANRLTDPAPPFQLTPEDVAEQVVAKIAEMEDRMNTRMDKFEKQASDALIQASELLTTAIGMMKDSLDHAISVNQKSDKAVAELSGRVVLVEARLLLLEQK